MAVLAALALAAAVSNPRAALVRPEETHTYETLLRQQALEGASFFGGSPCPSATVEPVSTLPVLIGDQPNLPAAIEHLRVTGCGRSSVQNIHVARVAGSPPWRMAIALPGDSDADMTLQQYTWRDVITALRVGLPSDCRPILGDVYVAARPGHLIVLEPGAPPVPVSKGEFVVRLTTADLANLDVARGWVEIWPITLCGNDRMVGIAFIPFKGQVRSFYVLLPIWQMVQERGAGARPEPAPPS